MFASYREDTLRLALETLVQSVPGIRAAVIVNEDGLVVASYPPADDFNDPTGEHSVAAASALIIGLAERTLGRLAQGELDRALIEGLNGSIGVFPCTADASLSVLIEKNAKLGLALTAARSAAREIRSIINS